MSHGTTFTRLFDANSQIENPNLIYPGEKITIPSPGEQLSSRVMPASDPTATTTANSDDSAVQQPTPTTTTTSTQQQSSASVSQTTTQTETQPVVQSTVPTNQLFSTSQTTTPTANNQLTEGLWDELAQCESGGDWSADTGNGFYGGLQFTLSSWQAVGGTGYPNQASESEQIALAQILQSEQGWNAWPACSLKLGLN